jgi:hypothetical protein
VPTGIMEAEGDQVLYALLNACCRGSSVLRSGRIGRSSSWNMPGQPVLILLLLFHPHPKSTVPMAPRRTPRR